MKALKKILIFALAAAGAAAFAGCGTAKTVVATSSNWYVRTGHTGIQPTSVENNEGFSPEICTYSVSLAADSGSNKYYSVSYDEAASSYRTEFYATEYDWNADRVIEKYRADKKETVYVLKTELNVSGVYEMKDGSGKAEFTDSMTTVSYFRSAGENLTPLYSYQDVASTSPAYLEVSSAEYLAERYEYSYETFYNRDATEATVVFTDKKANAAPVTSTEDFGKVKYTMFDNAYLYFAVRAMGIDDVGYAKTIADFIPVEGEAREFYVQTIAKETVEDGQIKAALAGAGYVGADAEVKANRVTVTSMDSLKGGTQNIWYAAVGNASSNACRSAMVKLAVPLSYGLGTMEITLKSVDSVLGAPNAD